MISQLGREHVISKHKIHIRYLGGYTNIYRQVPDLKRLFYNSTRTANVSVGQDENGDPVEVVNGYKYTPYTANIISGPNSFDPTAAGKFFSEMFENASNLSADIKIPFNLIIKNEFKMGAFYQ